MAVRGRRNGCSRPVAGSPARGRWALAVSAAAAIAWLGLASPSGAGAGASPAVDGTATISLSTRVSPATLALGTGFADAATLTPPPNGPSPTGTMSFSVYGPTDPGCSGPVLFSSINSLAAGPTTTSSAYTPPAVGSYRVTATYSGDANYQAVSTPCGDPSEIAVVGLGPTLTAISPGSGPAGGTDTVTITGTNLTGATTVDFGTTPAPATVIGSTEVSATAPAGSGTVDVTVTTPFGTTPLTSADRYTYASSSGAPAPVTPPAGVAPRPPAAQTGPAKGVTPSSASFTATVDPDGLATTAQFEYAVRLAGGVTRTARTPVQQIGSDLAAHAVIATATGLLAGHRYRVRVLAENAAGAAVGAASTFETATSSPAQPPVLGRTFDADPVSGLVYVRLPGAGQRVVPLSAARQLPVGAILDTRTGTVRVTSATASAGREQSGNFAGAVATVLQAAGGSGLTELDFVRASTARTICAASPGEELPDTDLGLLHATVTGRFETRGRYGSVTSGASGATWTTTDRCDGLMTSVEKGVVEVDEFASGRRVAVGAGDSLLAKAR